MHYSALVLEKQKIIKYVAPRLYFKRFSVLCRSNAIIRVLHNLTSHYSVLWSMKYNDSFCKIFKQKVLLCSISKMHYRNDRDYKCWSYMG